MCGQCLVCSPKGQLVGQRSQQAAAGQAVDYVRVKVVPWVMASQTDKWKRHPEGGGRKKQRE